MSASLPYFLRLSRHAVACVRNWASSATAFGQVMVLDWAIAGEVVVKIAANRPTINLNFMDNSSWRFHLCQSFCFGTPRLISEKYYHTARYGCLLVLRSSCQLCVPAAPILSKRF